MPLQRQEILKICEILAEEEGIRVAVKESFKGACCAFAGALLGGLFGGPIGLGIGGAAGSAMAAYKSQGKFKSAVYVIMYEMPEREQTRLVNAVENVIRNIDASDIITLLTLLNGNVGVKTAVIGLIKYSLTNDMGFALA